MSGCARLQQTPYDYVNPEAGTGFHGHTFPGATVPFGAVQLSPDNRKGDWDACSGYHYGDSQDNGIFGFSHTHLSGTGCCDLGDILFRPLCSVPEKAPWYAPTMYYHGPFNEKPGYYKVYLHGEIDSDGNVAEDKIDSNQIEAELTATEHVGVHRYKYTAEENTPTLVVDLAHMLSEDGKLNGCKVTKVSANEIEGYRNVTAWAEDRSVYFFARFSSHIKTYAAPDSTISILTFDLKEGEPLVAAVGLSCVSEANAKKNLDSEVPELDFDKVHNEARRKWEEALDVIQVEGGDYDQMSNFYTALYHSMVVPNEISDVDGSYLRHDDKMGKAPEGQKRYSTFSLWDTYRAWNPLMAMINPKLVNDMINSMLDQYDATGELPIWPLGSRETRTMIGYHAVSVIADAYLKGIRGFDAEKALEAMVTSSNINQKGSDYYVRDGYIPSNIKREATACTLEYAYDDWCIAQMAKEMGKDDIHSRYMERAGNYANVFDGNTRFFHGKREDGNWDLPFNPNNIGHEFTEATAWQYRFSVPHDVAGMVGLFGGVEPFAEALDSLFTAKTDPGMDLQDVTGLIGQYAHGNEPSHAYTYLFNYIGQPWKTQAWTRRILDEMYQPTPDGICGNEDCGQMSAWYVWTSLGLYPVCPGSDDLALTTPIFPKATIKLGNGKTLTITANNPGKNRYIKSVTLNGREIDSNFISYAELMKGGELKFELCSRPNKDRGTRLQLNGNSTAEIRQRVAVPYVDKDLYLFLDEIPVKLGCTTKGATIRYTLDGSEPTEESPEYKTAFAIDKSITIRAKAFKNGMTPSRELKIKAKKAELLPPVADTAGKQGVAYRYYEGAFKKVAEIEGGRFVEEGVMTAPDISKAKAEDAFGFIFTGLIDCPETGIYTFRTISDDGSVLWIDGNLVVNNDGSHSAVAATGKIALRKGLHAYRLLYLEDSEGQEFSWQWQLPSASSSFTPIIDERLKMKL